MGLRVATQARRQILQIVTWGLNEGAGLVGCHVHVGITEADIPQGLGVPIGVSDRWKTEQFALARCHSR